VIKNNVSLVILEERTGIHEDIFLKGSFKKETDNFMNCEKELTYLYMRGLNNLFIYKGMSLISIML